MLTARNLKLSFDGKPLIENVSFQISEGETLALLGPSGSGKTTLLRIIAGLEQAESGEVYWDNLSLQEIPPDNRNFGLVFQDYALFPHLDVAGNIGFGLRTRGVAHADVNRTVSDILRLINLSGWERRRVNSLSGGEQQRVALGRALATQPRLLMLDEPLSALDRMLREELIVEIGRILRHSRVPAIYVTHDQEEAFSIATRVAILHEGRILQEGTPAEITAHPATGWIAEFLGLGTVVCGRVVKKRPLVVKTILGQFSFPERRASPAVGRTVRVLVRPEEGVLRRTNPHDPAWKSATVKNIRTRGIWDRLFLSISEDLTVTCDVKRPVPIGTNVWWRPGKVQYLGMG
jgi:ABC-type Fe3+/spermidine/putrescine transport system ATPase subunit